MTLDIIFTVILCLCVLMTCIPTLPGALCMFAVTAIYAVIGNFETIQPEHLIIFGVITLVSMSVDYLSGLIGAKFGGANKKSLLFGIIGLFIGLILFPPFGLFLGLFTGVFIAELVQFQDHLKALKAASYSLAGVVVGTVVNVCLAIAFVVTFMVIVF